MENSTYKIIDRNWRCRRGEIDIIAYEGKTLCFIEVKYRRTNDFGSPAEAVDLRKQKQLIFLARIYLSIKNPEFESIRFDVVEVTPSEIRLIRDAFRQD
ncbi:MAG: YraN family protein [Elusimicrobia bacterium]|nr:YraN family protein [Elusimicrobiota bacterium]